MLFSEKYMGFQLIFFAHFHTGKYKGKAETSKYIPNFAIAPFCETMSVHSVKNADFVLKSSFKQYSLQKITQKIIWTTLSNTLKRITREIHLSWLVINVALVLSPSLLQLCSSLEINGYKYLCYTYEGAMYCGGSRVIYRRCAVLCSSDIVTYFY